MAIRTADKYDAMRDPVVDRLRRKSSQEWDMAGLARQDGDVADSERHTKMARDYDRQLADYLKGKV